MARALPVLLLLLLWAPAYGREGETVTGRVVDAQGKPVPGARVHVGQYWPGGIDDTDAEGRFSVTVAPNMPAPIRIFANGFRTKDVEAEPGTRGMRIVLDPGVTIRGRLEVPKGATMPTEVRVVTRTQRSRMMTTKVDAEGRFACTGFDAHPRGVEVALHAPPYAVFRATRASARDRPVLEIGRVPLAAARALTVLVRDHKQQPVAGAHLRVEVEGYGHFGWVGRTNEEGLAVFAATSNDRLLLRARLPNANTPGRRWEIEEGAEATRLEITLLPYVLVEGRLEWTGAGDAPWLRQDPVSVLATVHRDGKQVSTWFGRTRGEQASTFVLERADTGTFELRFSVALDRWLRSELVRVEIPRSALDAGRHDIGVVRIGPKPR
ncbi:MAG: hypothetical protein QNJ98_11815 [Planctomycetota bacterium]|nr:hypothetical protein [Planctomycetota bacterium]